MSVENLPPCLSACPRQHPPTACHQVASSRRQCADFCVLIRPHCRLPRVRLVEAPPRLNSGQEQQKPWECLQGRRAEAGRGWVKLCVAAARQIRCSAAERGVAGCRKKQTEARDSRRCRRQRSSAHGMSWPPSLAKPHVAPASFSPSRQLLPTTISCRAQSAVHAHRTQHLMVASCRAAKLLPQHLALDPAPSDKPRRACR